MAGSWTDLIYLTLISCIGTYILESSLSWLHQRWQGLRILDPQQVGSSAPPSVVSLAPIQANPPTVQQPEPEFRVLRGNMPWDWELVLWRHPDGFWVILDLGDSLAASHDGSNPPDVEDADTELGPVREDRFVG